MSRCGAVHVPELWRTGHRDRVADDSGQSRGTAPDEPELVAPALPPELLLQVIQVPAHLAAGQPDRRDDPTLPGAIQTPRSMPEGQARSWALLMDVPLPEGLEPPVAPEAHPADETKQLIPESLRGDASLVFLTFVQELAPRVAVWQRMKAEHVPTPDGFCSARTCRRGGYGTPHVTWPCSTRLLADWAGRAHRRREETE
jgi:hypothetical protein